MPSMSPIVPPSSITQTRGWLLDSVTGCWETLSTHSWMQSVMESLMDTLNCFAEVVAVALLVDDMLVHLAGGYVIVTVQGYV
ncbi:Protein of unknown function [Cotesia congregata]|uniref:Uncharacterized protein n=1 Tax=Cotesia congregata TaxID=51543 RepID=A0A8J2H3S6_COTCN|nr:Protein of unknown function [Cotesia congregata]